MNYRHYVAILIYSLALMACGAKQTPDTDKGPAVDQVISNEPFEDVHLQRTLRFRDLLPFSQATYQQTPAYVFRVDEPTELEIVAQSDVTDLLMLIVGPSFPYQDDDTYEFSPAIEDTFEPGTYRVYVGTWGQPGQNITYNLSIYHAASGQRHPEYQEPVDVEQPFDASWGLNDAADYVDRPHPTQEPHHKIDGQKAQSQQHDITLKPQARVQECPGIFDFDRPVATIHNLNTLTEDRLRILLNQAEGQRSIDTVMAVFMDGLLIFCSDDFESLFAGRVFSEHDHLGSELTIYGGIWAEDKLDSNGEVTIGLQVTRLPPEAWQVRTEKRTFSDATQHISVKGVVRDPIEQLSAMSFGYIRDAQRPDIIFHNPKGGNALQIDARLKEADSVLLVRTPDGEVLFNDDQPNSMDARLRIQDALKGDYQIWIGGTGRDEALQGLVTISTPKAYKDSDKRLRKIDALAKEGSTTVRATKTTDTTGNLEICDGFASGHLDLQTPSVVIRNDTSHDGILLVRTQAAFDTILYSPHNSETCGDDEIAQDAAFAAPLSAGESIELWAGAVDKAHAQDAIEVQYILLTLDMIGSSDVFYDFITP